MARNCLKTDKWKPRVNHPQPQQGSNPQSDAATIARAEAALTRIRAATDRLAARHQQLRTAAADTVAELDRLIDNG